MPKVYRSDRWTGTWNCPGRTSAQGPLTVAFDDGVAELTDDQLDSLGPWMERNQFSVEDNRPAKRKAAAKKAKGKK